MTAAEPWLGPYRLLHERGEGTFARTYLAEHPADGRLVAIKVANAWNELIEAAFRQEYLLGSRLQHPHLGEVLDHGRTAAGRPYLVLAFVDGEALRPGPRPEADVVRLGLQLARALMALHERGLVHRDLTPGNVLVDAAGLARLIDFGMLTPAGAAGGVAGTPLYMAPEVLDGQPAEARSDLYALGALLYRQATGQAPFEELPAEQLVEAVLRRVIPPPQGLSPALAGLVMRLLAKDPADRPASAAEVAAQLGRLDRGQPLPLATGPWQPSEAWEAWAGLNAAPGLYAFQAPAGGGVTRALDEAFRAVRRLDLPALLVSGEVGAGPYGLVEAIARWAAAHAPQALEQADEAARRVLATTWDWVPAPEDGPAASTEGLPEAALTLLAELLSAVAAGGRLAVMLDQWEAADPASQALLKRGWAGQLAGFHWLVGSHAEVAGARSWSLPPLPEAAISPWLAACLHGQEPQGLAARLHQLSGGNPGWSYRALQALHQGGQLALPESVDAALAVQFEGLSADQRALAEVMALYGAPFAPADLAPFAALLPEGWGLELPVLVARGLFEARGGSYRWSTGWWPAWVREQTPPSRAARLAWDMAHALERQWLEAGGGQLTAGQLHRLAELYERSEDAEARVRFALAAGQACARLFANESALQHFAHGLRACARLPEAGEHELALELARADVQRMLGQVSTAAAAYEGCLPRVDAPAPRGRLLISLGKCYQMMNQWELARQVLEEAVGLLDTPEAEAERLRGLGTLARVLFFLGRRSDAAARAEQTLELARSAGQRAFEAEAASFLGQLLASEVATAERGMAFLEQSLALREGLRDLLGRADSHLNLGNALYNQGRFRAAYPHFRATLEIAGRTGSQSDRGYAAVNLALCEIELGDFRLALDNAELSVELGGALGDSFLIGLGSCLAAHAAMHLGELAAADAAHETARERERSLGSQDLRLFGLLFEAERQAFMGRFSRSGHAASLARELVRRGVGVELAPRTYLALAEARVFEGVLDEAREALEAAHAAIAQTGSQAGAVAARRLEGWLAFRGGEREAARAHWAAALAQARAQGLRPLEQRLLLALHLDERSGGAAGGGPKAAGRGLDAAEVLVELRSLSEGLRTPEPLALACLGLAVQQARAGRDLQAERLARRGQDLLAIYMRALPGHSERAAFQAHPERAAFAEADGAEEAQRQQRRERRLEMLLSMAEKLGASREADVALAQVRHFTLELTQAERVVVLLAHGPEGLVPWGEEDASVSRTIVQRVVETRRAECVLDTASDEGLKAQRSVMDLDLRSVMCVPLAVEQVLHGVLYVDSRIALGAFTAEDLRMVEAIARQAAVALDNARLHQIQRGLIRQKDEQLRRIQASDQVIAQLKELDRLRAEFFEAESHDLRAPLGSIKAAAQGMLKGLMGPLTDEQRELLEGIEYSQRFLMAKIDGILDAAKLEAEKLSLVPRAVPLDRPVKLAAWLVAAQAGGKGVAIRYDGAALAGLSVLADERRLEQIVLNLLGNAVKFTDEGRIELAAERRGEVVALSVRDTGRGIPPERQAALFERFGASSDQQHGSGLGLWLVKQLVDLHGGTIEVESSPAGTCFTVVLPAVT